MFLIPCPYRRDEPRGFGSVDVICGPMLFSLQQGIVVALEKSVNLFSGDDVLMMSSDSVTCKICNIVLHLKLNIKVTIIGVFSWCSAGVFHIIGIICQSPLSRSDFSWLTVLTV